MTHLPRFFVCHPHVGIARTRIALGLFGLLIFSACGGGGDGGTTQPPVPTITSITVSPGTLALQVGATGTVSAVVAPSGVSSAMTWTSDAPSIATVSGSGTSATITAVAAGTTTIRAISASNAAVTGTATVTVTPVPLQTVFEGAIVGATNAEVEAACKVTPLPDANNSQYVIRQLERLLTNRAFSDPWPGRVNGEVHARQTTTEGKLRFSCTVRLRDGSLGTQFNVELGQPLGPVVTNDVTVCESNGSGGSRSAAINTGQLACPYDFGNMFPITGDFLDPGPFQTVEQFEGPACTIFRPTTLGAGGKRHPIILWGNGITLSPSWYRGLLTHFASHGFVVAAGDTSRTGTASNGQNLLGCLAYLESQNALAGSVYENKLNVYRVGASGHSAGGAGAVMAGRDPRITATAPVQPGLGLANGSVPNASAQQNGPMFLASGELDVESTPAIMQSIYAVANGPIFWGTRLGSVHNDGLFDAPLYRRPLIAWFRYYLMLDNNARSLFYGQSCQLCTSAFWSVSRKNGIL